MKNAAITLRYADGVEEIDIVEPMWNALQEHHVRITPELDPQTRGAVSPIKAEWASRGRGGTTTKSLSRNLRVRLVSAGPSGARTQGGRIAALFGRPRTPHRAVSAAARRARRFRDRLSTNLDAHRFYERMGFSQGFVIYHGKRSLP